MKKYIFAMILLIQCFTINLQAQKILYAVPNKLKPSQLYDVKFYCTGTHFLTKRPIIKLSNPNYQYYFIAPGNIPINDTVVSTMIVSNNIKAGIYDIIFKDSMGDSMILEQGIEKLGGPRLVSISPDTCNRGDTITLRVIGSYTKFTEDNIEGTALYLKNDVICTSDKRIYYNDTVMDVKFRLLSKYYGLCDFFYWGKIESWMKYYGALYIIPPDKPIYISHLSVDTVSRGKTYRFYIYGKNTQFSLITSKNAICLMGKPATYPNSYTVINDTIIDVEFTIPFRTNGLLHLWLSIPTYGSMFLYNCLQVVNNPDMMPAIVSISPDSSIRNKFTSITINCKNTVLLMNNNAMVFLTRNSLTPIQADSVIILNDTTLSALFWIPEDAEPGKWSLMISNAFDGTFTADSVFTLKKEVGIEENQKFEKLYIWPNPTKGIINLIFPKNIGFYTIQVIDSRGRICYSKELSLSNNNISYTSCDLLALLPGSYLIRLGNEKCFFINRLIILK